ncbi:MAG TPA: hypothetical protein VLI21_11465, partial [Casimicrobiaceae bacterium]|nr:hypothetical protein [Casimicrobiaceae bacterium]
MIGIRTRASHPHAIDVPVHDVDRNAVARAEHGGELICNHHRTMSASGAPDGYRQVTFAFTFETRQTKFEQRTDALEKPAAVRLREHEILHRLGATGQVSQLGHEVWVVQEAHVEQQISVDRRTEF